MASKGLLRSSLSDSLTSQPLGVVVVVLMRIDRFFDILSTSIAVVSMIFVVVVNVFLYFGYYPSKTPTPCLPSGSSAWSCSPTPSTETPTTLFRRGTLPVGLLPTGSQPTPRWYGK